MILDREAGASVVACGACGWVRPYPRLGGKDADAELKEAFAQHVCAQHPRERKPRQDVNQPAARIVRKATEREYFG